MCKLVCIWRSTLMPHSIELIRLVIENQYKQDTWWELKGTCGGTDFIWFYFCEYVFVTNQNFLKSEKKIFSWNFYQIKDLSFSPCYLNHFPMFRLQLSRNYKNFKHLWPICWGLNYARFKVPLAHFNRAPTGLLFNIIVFSALQATLECKVDPNDWSIIEIMA